MRPNSSPPKPHYIEADLNEGWVLAGLIRLELYLKRYADFERWVSDRFH